MSVSLFCVTVGSEENIKLHVSTAPSAAFREPLFAGLSPGFKKKSSLGQMASVILQIGDYSMVVNTAFRSTSRATKRNVTDKTSRAKCKIKRPVI